MTLKAIEKREYILNKAKDVFIHMGFNNVTMKDIIETCEISRGGVYLYFSSVGEIFEEVVKRHNKIKNDELKHSIEQNMDFNLLIDTFFSGQRDRLLKMDRSLFAAMNEYCFSNKSKSVEDFYNEQYANAKEMFLEILRFGKKENAIKAENIELLADSIMFLIEGLRSLFSSTTISEKMADEQIHICKKMIFSDLF